MSETLKPMEFLILWRLAISDDGGEFNPDFKPRLEKGVRDRLVAAGLIEISKRKKPPKNTLAMYIDLTETGWELLTRSFKVSFPPRANTVNTLERLLRKIERHLEANGATLDEFISGKIYQNAIDRESHPPGFDETLGDQPTKTIDWNSNDRRPVEFIHDSIDIPGLIEDAYRRITHNQENIRVRLADLRREIPAIDRDELDRALIDMADKGRVALYPLENPLEIGDDDRTAALYVPSGHVRHIVYLGERSS